VPVAHEGQEKLPAVSGSSGHLVIERVVTDKEQPVWPGQVFSDPALSFEAAMQQYVQATQDRFVHQHLPSRPVIAEPNRRRKEAEGRVQRHQLLEQRKREDRVWRTAKAAFSQVKKAHQKQRKVQREQQLSVWEQDLAAWIQRKEQRCVQHQVRKLENTAWHQRNYTLKTGDDANPVKRDWLAVLVITDNCSRRCLGLPLFRSGGSVTSQEVVNALRTCLPPELQFMITDQGTHFKTQLMKQLAQENEFVHVLVYRHRPQSNGIAERFVQTLKRWLRNHSWNSPEEMEILIALFVSEYNQRPHQGLAIPGLSPNEFAQRFWLM
jgi:transposase InsO family protein